VISDGKKGSWADPLKVGATFRFAKAVKGKSFASGFAHDCLRRVFGPDRNGKYDLWFAGFYQEELRWSVSPKIDLRVLNQLEQMAGASLAEVQAEKAASGE